MKASSIADTTLVIGNLLLTAPALLVVSTVMFRSNGMVE